MARFTQRNFKVASGSHIPVLIKMIQMSEGPILELGTGFYSTPILHWICAENKRKLVSYESSADYFEVVKRYATDFHEVNFVEDWSKIDISEYWGLVFVDHYPAEQRILEMARVTNNADYVVAHDSEPRNDKLYHYSTINELYKYRYDYDKLYPNTVVFSNKNDLINLL